MTEYHELFAATAAIFAGLWALFIAFCIYMSQQRATTGARLTFVTALTPARALVANAYFFAGMLVSLLNLMPQSDTRYGAQSLSLLISMITAYAPLVMLYRIARKEGRQSMEQFKRISPFYLIVPVPLIAAFSYSSSQAATVIFSLLCFGCLWTLMAAMWLVFFPNEWSKAAAIGPIDDEAVKMLEEVLAKLKQDQIPASGDM
ncbi:MAG TPA: hypothetical protein VGG22_07970 [Candidatus Baltobacteraceae bacterium]